ncbi:hypothetical protein EMIHUDRAFT_353295 [Emiliania huxleyi CCMP1516]|uniref:Uncharacterized protein n=2 Tax=Emiliania huxleyi TaxID=2903 RepID=A0A0D3K0S6_EMIH1|nr:hypothetical protein EMIHUDRAFT_353295 [Emiliania huxleyi CCMP1516]EOD29361.1 hypothetical protein EMIHUDRAFT_353295 [Emiliania huxleyi CCMP1516]|eukprot:XP_005781790.1 hypothetical protein EMIHUDRAFT_353295 [Emiliania huxleyi CCMP1516]
MTQASILDAFTWLFRAVYTLASSIFLLLFEGCGRLLGIFGALAVVALVLCGCNHGGEGAWYTGAVVGDDGQLTPIGLLLFAAGVLWAPLGWSTADLAVGAALAPTLYIWLLPQLRDGCSGFLGEVGADVSLLGLCRLSRSMGALVALFYPALLLLNLRGGAGAGVSGPRGRTASSLPPEPIRLQVRGPTAGAASPH